MAVAGGTERMITEKANYFSDCYGYDVTIITCFQRADEKNYFYTSKNVKQINLEIPFFSQYQIKYTLRLLAKWRMYKLLNKCINEIVKQIDPDILIGVSRFNANIVSTIKCKAKKIIECHEVKYNTIHDAGLKRSLLTKILERIFSNNYFNTIERNADAVITLTEGDKSLWKKAKCTIVIPNFSTTPINKLSDCTSKRIIAVGRLAWEKGFERLIEIWGMVASNHTDWHLDIYGEGRMYDKLMHMKKIYKAENLTIHNCTSDISREYANSSICAVTSHFEGFSLVLLEAMRHGLPCIAFDCPFGPRSIIDDGINGFLIDNDDKKAFAEKLCYLIENIELRIKFSKAAVRKSSVFEKDSIMQQWKYLFEQLCTEQ